MHQSKTIPPEKAREETRPFSGFPLWASFLLTTALMLLGLIITKSLGDSSAVGKPFCILFLLAAILTSLLTQPRWLFINTVSLPIFFAVGSIITSMAINKQPNQSAKTLFLMSLYPMMRYFLWLLAAMIIAIVIAKVRLNLLSRTTPARVAPAARGQQSAKSTGAARTTTSSTRTAPRRTGDASADTDEDRPITVEELMRRQRERQSARRQQREKATGKASTTTTANSPRRGARTYAPRPQRTVGTTPQSPSGTQSKPAVAWRERAAGEKPPRLTTQPPTTQRPNESTTFSFDNSRRRVSETPRPPCPSYDRRTTEK